MLSFRKIQFCGMQCLTAQRVVRLPTCDLPPSAWAYILCFIGAITSKRDFAEWLRQLQLRQ